MAGKCFFAVHLPESPFLSKRIIQDGKVLKTISILLSRNIVMHSVIFSLRVLTCLGRGVMLSLLGEATEGIWITAAREWRHSALANSLYRLQGIE